MKAGVRGLDLRSWRFGRAGVLPMWQAGAFPLGSGGRERAPPQPSGDLPPQPPATGVALAMRAAVDGHGVGMHPPGAFVRTGTHGRGRQDGSRVTVSYRGTLVSGHQFDAAKSFSFVLGAGEVIKGWDRGIRGMRVGGTRKLACPPKLGYGAKGCAPDIPPNATLHFTVTLKAVA